MMFLACGYILPCMQVNLMIKQASVCFDPKLMCLKDITLCRASQQSLDSLFSPGPTSQVNMMTNQASVRFDPTLTGPRDIIKAVEEAGFEASLWKDQVGAYLGDGLMDLSLCRFRCVTVSADGWHHPLY